MSADQTLFRFAQVELPWALGPPDGRYLLRPDPDDDPNPDDDDDDEPSHVIVFATLGAPERRRLGARRRARTAAPEPAPTPVLTGRATVIDVADPLRTGEEAAAWLRAAGEPDLERGLITLNGALRAFRLVCADPYLHPVGRRQAIVARIGYGAGEQVADGLWAEARELRVSGGRRRRAQVLAPQARLASVLAAREAVLACEELILRARLDLDQHRPREAALQLLVALDAALAELSADARAQALAERLAELRDQRDVVAAAAQTALTGPLSPAELEAVAFTVARVQAALRARAAAHA